MFRHLVERSKTPVIDLLLPAARIQFHHLYGEWIVELGRWIVEREMTVGAYAATDDVDGRSIQLGGILSRGPRRIVRGVEKMDSAEREAIED